MIARNFRRFPEALALQLQFEFGAAIVRRIKAACARPSGTMQFVAKAKEAEDIPIGARIKTPTGAIAVVEGYRGHRREHRLRLVCRYVNPDNKRFDVVQLLPELVVVIETGE